MSYLTNVSGLFCNVNYISGLKFSSSHLFSNHPTNSPPIYSTIVGMYGSTLTGWTSLSFTCISPQASPWPGRLLPWSPVMPPHTSDADRPFSSPQTLCLVRSFRIQGASDPEAYHLSVRLEGRDIGIFVSNSTSMHTCILHCAFTQLFYSFF